MRPVWEPNAATIALCDKAHSVAAAMGLDLPHGSAVGGSDGTFTGAMEIPTLDGLAVRAADAIRSTNAFRLTASEAENR